ncbi:hypothetical protein TALC_01018 [Thermoplasmatales archaeon BRNA1]|nr:hypothetical protein TALC_01018 [Thermoplasmatales archaeon BRNA1]
MGFGDKLKAGISNAGNYTEQKADEARYNSKISDKKNEKAKAIKEAGEKMFALYLDGKSEINDEIKALYEKAIECDKEIEKLEKEKAEMVDAAKKERQDRRDEVNAKKEEQSD